MPTKEIIEKLAAAATAEDVEAILGEEGLTLSYSETPPDEVVPVEGEPEPELEATPADGIDTDIPFPEGSRGAKIIMAVRKATAREDKRKKMEADYLDAEEPAVAG